MKLSLIGRWGSLHWATRIVVLTVILAVLRWQSRYTHAISNPMFGWPMPFNDVWYEGARGEWLPHLLLLDVAA